MNLSLVVFLLNTQYRIMGKIFVGFLNYPAQAKIQIEQYDITISMLYKKRKCRSMKY